MSKTPAEATDIDFRLDVCGVGCPIPLIELAKAANTLKTGQTLEVIGNDPVFESSVRDFCRTKGHSILNIHSEGLRRITILMRMGG